MAKNTADVTFEIDGVTYIVEVKTQQSKAAGATVNGDVLKRAELAVAAELARRGQATPHAFRFIRKAYGLAANRVAELFGTTPETISRWEKGRTEMPRYAWLAMAAWTGASAEAVASACTRDDAGKDPLVQLALEQMALPHLTAEQRREIVERMTAAAKSAIEGL